MKRFTGWLRRRPEEGAALAFGVVVAMLEVRYGGTFRIGTYFMQQGAWLFGALLCAYGIGTFGTSDGSPGARGRAALRATLRFTRDWAPFGALLLLYENVILLIGRIRSVYYDPLMLAADTWLFGAHPGFWLEPLVSRWRTEWFTFFYLLLFALPIVSGGLLYLQGRRTDFRQFMLAFTLAGLAGFALYVLVPVIGPRYYLAKSFHVTLSGAPRISPVNPPLDGALWKALAVVAGPAERGAPRNCFPSLHTTWGVIVLAFAYRQMRPLFYAYLLPVGSLLLATVYLRFHYVVDILAGLGLAAFVVACVPKLEERLRRDQEPEPPLPVLLRGWRQSRGRPPSG